MAERGDSNPSSADPAVSAAGAATAVGSRDVSKHHPRAALAGFLLGAAAMFGAMGSFVSSRVAGGGIGRIGVALVTAAVGGRWASGGLAVLPLGAAILMQRALVDLPLPERTDGRLRGARRQLRNRGLLRTGVIGSTFFFSFIGVFSYAPY